MKAQYPLLDSGDMLKLEQFGPFSDCPPVFSVHIMAPSFFRGMEKSRCLLLSKREQLEVEPSVPQRNGLQRSKGSLFQELQAQRGGSDQKPVGAMKSSRYRQLHCKRKPANKNPFNDQQLVWSRLLGLAKFPIFQVISASRALICKQSLFHRIDEDEHMVKGMFLAPR